jgi:hypothetical protein
MEGLGFRGVACGARMDRRGEVCRWTSENSIMVILFAWHHSKMDGDTTANPSPGVWLSRWCEEAVEPWMREITM